MTIPLDRTIPDNESDAALLPRQVDSTICINRASEHRDEFEFDPSRLRRKRPRIKIPLAGADPEGLLDLEGVLWQTCGARSFRDRID